AGLRQDDGTVRVLSRRLRERTGGAAHAVAEGGVGQLLVALAEWIEEVDTDRIEGVPEGDVEDARGAVRRVDQGRARRETQRGEDEPPLLLPDLRPRQLRARAEDRGAGGLGDHGMVDDEPAVRGEPVPPGLLALELD